MHRKPTATASSSGDTDEIRQMLGVREVCLEFSETTACGVSSGVFGIAVSSRVADDPGAVSIRLAKAAAIARRHLPVPARIICQHIDVGASYYRSLREKATDAAD